MNDNWLWAALVEKTGRQAGSDLAAETRAIVRAALRQSREKASKANASTVPRDVATFRAFFGGET